MGHGLFGELTNIEMIISKWIVMWKLYTGIIYSGKNYLVLLFFKEILHYLKCHSFSNRCDNKLHINVCNISRGVIALCYCFHAQCKLSFVLLCIQNTLKRDFF
jgi:hypothetical protein